jgi:hypothetical protein
MRHTEAWRVLQRRACAADLNLGPSTIKLAF